MGKLKFWKMIPLCAAAAAVLLFHVSLLHAAGQADTSAVVSAAAQILYNNEGTYDSVNPNDNGALSIGKLQWHGPRALSLLRSIVAKNDTQAQNLLGSTLYKEVKSSSGSTAWSARKLTTAEASAVKKLLATDESKAEQDVLAKNDITDYIQQGQRLGMTNGPALVYFSDLANQGGSGAAVRVAASASNFVGGYAKVTLNELHIAAICDSVMGKSAYHSRRFRTYIYAADLGWTYCSESDSYIPFTYTTAKDKGAAWVQRSLNTCMKAGLTVSGTYDSATKTAVSKFQSAKSLSVDGYAGKDTIVALMKAVFKKETVTPGTGLPTQDPSGSQPEDPTEPENPTKPEDPTEPENPVKPQDPVITLKKAVLKASKKSYGVNKGSSAFQLTVTSNHSQSPITYQSSNKSVATVSSSGKVTVKGAGQAQITASQAKTAEYTAAELTISVSVYSTAPADYETPTGSLYAGKNMKQSHVQWLQASLIVLNGANITVNGTWTATMTKLVKDFQTKCGITSDGIVGNQTLGMIKQMLVVRVKKPTVTVKCTTKANTLTWNKNANANRVYIYRKIKGGSYIRIKVITNMSTTSYSDTKAKKGSTYYYVLKYVSEYNKIRILGPSSKGVKGIRK